MLRELVTLLGDVYDPWCSESIWDASAFMPWSWDSTDADFVSGKFMIPTIIDQVRRRIGTVDYRRKAVDYLITLQYKNEQNMKILKQALKAEDDHTNLWALALQHDSLVRTTVDVL